MKKKNHIIKKKAKGYLKNSELLNELILSKAQDKLTKEAVDMFIIMVNRISTTLSYENPDDRNDTKQVALLKCWKYWKNFNPEKSNNPFSYFTQVIKNGFAEGFKQLHPLNTRNSTMISLSNIDLSSRI